MAFHEDVTLTPQEESAAQQNAHDGVRRLGILRALAEKQARVESQEWRKALEEMGRLG